MTPEALHRVVVLHGTIAWLGGLLVAFVAVLLLRGKTHDRPWFRALAAMATASTASAFITGVLLDEHYRVHLRQKMFLTSKTLGWLFERKMHLSFGAFVFACVGLMLLIASRNKVQFFRSARSAYVAAALFALGACTISSIVR